MHHGDQTMESSCQHIAVAVVHDGTDRVLIARRPLNKPQGGKWEFPGGKIQPTEGVYQALKRELMEEIGIEITRASPLIKVKSSRGKAGLMLDVWKVDAFRGAAHGREGQEIKWVRPLDMKGYAFPPPDIEIIEFLCRNRSNSC